MSTIFISHSSQDNDIARKIERRLASQGHYSVFLDLDPEKGIVAGQSWERTLYRKLRACRVVIALCTDHYLDSHWCFTEIALARMEGKHIIALQADPLAGQAKMPAILTERQFIDMRRNEDEGYQRLWRALRKLDLLSLAGEWDPKKPPYLGLGAYQEEHAPVFFGREEESHAGIELLERGAPGLIMVLGASGSGKSSLARAGMLPHLRPREDDWLIVDPFRPGSDPMDELTESLVQSFRRYAPEHAAEAGSRQRIRERLLSGLPDQTKSASISPDESDAQKQIPDAAEDERLRRLMESLERLREDPHPLLAGRLRDYLEWSLEDLRRIYYGRDEVVSSPAGVSRNTTPLVDIVQDLRRVSQRRFAQVLLVVDQFEELLSRKQTDEESDRFLAMMRASIEADHSPLRVLGTMRSDFLGLFQRNPVLRAIDFESLSIGPMKIEGMRRVIEEPARLAAIELESGLADRLLEDTETSDALPLLSFTLWVLWRNHRHNGKFELAEYEKLGGLQGAITDEADAVLASARRQNKVDELRNALLQMARLSEDGSYARRPVSRDDAAIRRIEPILEKLVERRILFSRMEGDKRIVEVAHEALFRAWKPLRAWLDNARSELLLKQQLERDAKAWQESGRAADNLWRGGRLLQAREQMGKQNLRSTVRDDNLVAQFVRAGLRRRLRLRATVTAITIAVIAVLAGIAVIAVNERNAAQRQRDLALSRQLALQASKDLPLSSKSSVGQNYFRALLEAVHAVRVRPTLEARSSLLSSLQATEYPLQFLWGHRDAVISIAFSPNGKILASASADNLILWDVDQHNRIGVPLDGHQGGLMSIAFSPDGKVLAAASSAGTVLWDMDQRKPIGESLKGHQKPVTSVAFSPDGKILAAASDETVTLWDVDQLKPIGETPKVHQKPVVSVTFSPDGKILAAASFDSTVILWDVEQRKPIGKPIEGHPDGLKCIAFSPDGKILAAANFAGTITLWDVDRRIPIGEPLKGHEDFLTMPGAVNSVVFSPDGKILASASIDKTVILWDVDQRKPKGKPLRGHEAWVTTVAFSPDGKILASASYDTTLILWDLDQRKSISKPLKEHQAPVYSVAYSPDGKILASASKDATLILWDVDKPEPEPIGEPLKGHQKTVSSVAFSPDGKILSAASGETVILWDVDQGKPIGESLKSQNGAVYSVAFSRDGKILASADQEQTVTLWDVEQRKSIGEPLKGHKLSVSSVAFSPNGKILASASLDETVILWDVDQRKRIGEPLKSQNGAVFSVAFSRAGKILASANQNQTVTLWDVEQHKPIGMSLKGHEGWVTSIAFSPDDKILVSASSDGTLRLWDVDLRKPIGPPLKGHQGRGHSVTFSPVGNILAYASQYNNTVILWELDLESWIGFACHRANRNLSRKEWEEIVGDDIDDDIDFEPACSGLPVPEE